MMIPLMTEVSKDWHSSVTNELRVQQIKKISMGVLPPAMHNVPVPPDKMEVLVNHAKETEKNIFESANSRSEYYYMIAEKIYKCQKDLEQEKQQQISLSDCQSESQHQKVWQSSVTRELRDHLTQKVKEVDQSIPLDLAVNVEQSCFAAASSRSEYYHMLAEKVYQIKRALEARKFSAETPLQSSSTSSHQISVTDMELFESMVNEQTSEGDSTTAMMQLLADFKNHSLNETNE